MKGITRIISLILTCLLVVRTSTCCAQYLRLNNDKCRNGLYFDLLRIVNYNGYEHWRWGAGFYWVSPSMPYVPQWQVHTYGAYGIHDKRFKYGIHIARNYRGLHWWRPFVSISDDLTQNTSAAIQNSFSLLHGKKNTLIVASQFVRQQALSAGISARWNTLLSKVEFNYKRQQMLFDNTRLLYPTRNDVMPNWSHLCEMHTQISIRGITTDIRCGTASDAPGWWYLRTLLQYDYKKIWEDKTTLELFFQTGLAAALCKESNNPLHQLFEQYNIGGSYNSFFHFHNCLLTLPPESFMADHFLRTNIHYQLPVVGWNHWLSAPQPFAQVMTTVGRHYKINDWSAIGEATAGITGLWIWQRLDFGCAIAYQLFNISTGTTSIRPDSNYKRWAFVICATASF